MATDPKRHRSIFELSPNFFDSCILLQSPYSSPPEFEVSGPSRTPDDAVPESESEIEIIDHKHDDVNNSDHKNISSSAKLMQRWSCNTCKAEFESLQEQRLHFKSDIHRFNIKLSIAGKNIIKEEDFDETTSDSLCKDYDISSISGSEDEEERDAGVRHARLGGFSKNKIFVQLQNGDRVSLWKCLLLDESENISFENDKYCGGDVLDLTPDKVVEKLKYINQEPRDNTRLRIVLLARGGHFAGCVLDGNSLVAHKTFHRYVIRAKAGKKQSSKDASGRTIHSAGASLRRYNELGLKRDIQDLLASWKPHFALASNIFISAPSDNRQLFFDGEKPYFYCPNRAIRNIPLTIRRPTLKEARRIYNLLTQISPEISSEITKDSSVSGVNSEIDSFTESSKMGLTESIKDTKTVDFHSLVEETDGLSVPLETEKERGITGISTPLHEAARSGDTQKVLELLEQGLDPCIKDEKGRTPYVLANEKEVRNTFRRYMASNLDKWDWQAAQVPSALTKEMEEAQAAKQAEKDAKRKAKAKELKKLRKAKEKKAQEAESAQSQNSSIPTHKEKSQPSGSSLLSKEEKLKRAQDIEREMRAAAAERRIAAMAETQKTQSSSSLPLNNTTGSDILCSCCNVSLSGKVPFHRYHYKYCSTSCMHVHRESLEDG